MSQTGPSQLGGDEVGADPGRGDSGHNDPDLGAKNPGGHNDPDLGANGWSLLDDTQTGPEEHATSVTSLDALLAQRTPETTHDTTTDGYNLGLKRVDMVEDSGASGDDRGGDGRAPTSAQEHAHAHPRPTDATGLVVGNLRYLAVDSIRPNQFQPRRRFDESQLASLTESVRELGVLQPILVREIPAAEIPAAELQAGAVPTGEISDSSNVQYELVAGERRWRASRRAGLTRIPALIRDLSDLRSLEEAIVENLHRADLNALEEAAAYQQLIDEFALSQSQIAHRVGKSRSAVANTLRLTQLPVSVQRMVVDGAITAGHARAILAVPAVDQRVFANRVVDEALSVRTAEQLAQDWDNNGGLGKKDARGANSTPTGRQGGRADRSSTDRSSGALEVESQLEDLLDTRVRVSQANKGGKIVIEFADSEDLARIFQLVTPESGISESGISESDIPESHTPESHTPEPDKI